MKLPLHIPSPVKQVALIITCSFFALCFVNADEPVVFQSMKIGNTVVNNVRVKETTPTYIVVTHDGGGSKLNRKSLPPELKALYPYDEKAAAAYEQQQAAEQLERNKKAGIKRDEANRQLKIELQQRQQKTKDQIDKLEAELAQLEKEMVPMKGKAKGKRNSVARQELDSSRDRKQNLIHSIGEQQAILDKINKQLAALP